MTNPGGQQPAESPTEHREKVDFSGVEWKSVEWTLLCMLYLRACESRVAGSILGDHVAAQAVERIDYDWERIHRTVRPALNQFGVALRGVQFDALITNYLDSQPEAIVLHLGSGLHSRAFRLPAAKVTRWFDVDLPQIIALRRQLYSETDSYRMIGSSVTDAGWLDDLPAGGPVMIAAEGLLMYLTPAEVTDLLHRLVDRFDTGELVADQLSQWAPRVSKIAKWGTRDGSEITRWEPRLRLIEDSSVIAGFDKIPLRRPRRLYRMQHVIPLTRKYDRIFRYAF